MGVPSGPETTYRLTDLDEQRHRFILLSGCSGGGKSTLLAKLASRGLPVVDVPGRQIVKEQRFVDGPALPWVDPVLFVELSVSRALQTRSRSVRQPESGGFVRCRVVCGRAGCRGWKVE